MYPSFHRLLWQILTNQPISFHADCRKFCALRVASYSYTRSNPCQSCQSQSAHCRIASNWYPMAKAPRPFW